MVDEDRDREAEGHRNDNSNHVLDQAGVIQQRLVPGSGIARALAGESGATKQYVGETARYRWRRRKST
jgi:hypothetical protein